MRKLSVIIARWSLVWLVLLVPFLAKSAEYREQIERDFPIRSIGRLHVTNLRGGITVQGWALDRIRVEAKRVVDAESQEAAKKLFAAMDFRYREIDGDIELAAEYGRGWAIEQRLLDRSNPKTRTEMVVKAPAGLKLGIWAADAPVSIKAWRAPLEVRTTAGSISIEDVRAENVVLSCPECPIKVHNVSGSIRCTAGTGTMKITSVKGANVYVETVSGDQEVFDVEGGQLYVTKNGSFRGEKLKGRVEFHSQSGDIRLIDGRGFASGRTDSGDIFLKMLDWTFNDRAIIESQKGTIEVRMPRRLDADVEVWSLKGSAKVTYAVQKLPENRAVGPDPANFVRGRIGAGGEQLRIFSKEGNVSLLRSDDK